MKSTHTQSVSVDGLRVHYERAGQVYERQDLFRSTGELGLPVLLVWGDEDQVTPITRLDTVHELLRPRQTHVITQCGHMAPYERPDNVGDLLASFAVPHPDRLKP